MNETLVNPQITDAVTQTNVKTLGESPAQALGNAYQATDMATENAGQVDAGMQDMDDSVVSAGNSSV